MSQGSTEVQAGRFNLPTVGAWPNLWKAAAGLGLLGAALCAHGASVNPKQFAFSWLFSFMAFLTLGLGSLFFVFIQHLTVSHWSVTVRRVAEFCAAAIPVFVVLFLPLLFLGDQLYEWQHHGHGAEHDAHHVVTPHHALHAELLEKKSGYFSWFYLRAPLYFLAWIGIGLFYFLHSVRQDRTGDVRHTLTMQRLAPAAAALFALSITFAAFDWMMSLEPTWYSTIYGVYVFAGSVVSIHALVILMSAALMRQGVLKDVVNVGHLHDLGKMMFGFIVFWAYIGFSQMMLIWYANIPEETAYYHLRWYAGGWREVSIFLLLGHFVFPFVFLLSRNIKRRVPLLMLASAWMLFMHLVDLYWFVMPNLVKGSLAPHWMDIAAVLAVGGTYAAVIFFLMGKFPLIPVRDPRLPRTLEHAPA